jgi:hypothetical protein
MDAEIPEPTAQGEEGGCATTFTPLQRLLAGIALAALLASAAISSWWILDGQVDFVDAVGGVPAAEARTPSGH